jgi:hypothetical protein
MSNIITNTSNNGIFTISGGSTTISPYYQSANYEYETKVLDIEKLLTLEETKRNMIFELFINFTKCKDYDIKKIIKNTLESYGVIIEQKALERKIKISNINK